VQDRLRDAMDSQLSHDGLLNKTCGHGSKVAAARQEASRQ
jgi:hypothetical protein